MRAGSSRLLLPAAGFTVWALAFVLIYASLSFGCAFGWDEVRLGGLVSLQRAQLVLLFLVATAASAVAAWALRPATFADGGDPPGRFLGTVGFGAALAALASTLATFAPVLALSTCV